MYPQQQAGAAASHSAAAATALLTQRLLWISALMLVEPAHLHAWCSSCPYLSATHASGSMCRHSCSTACPSQLSGGVKVWAVHGVALQGSCASQRASGRGVLCCKAAASIPGKHACGQCASKCGSSTMIVVIQGTAGLLSWSGHTRRRAATARGGIGCAAGTVRRC